MGLNELLFKRNRAKKKSPESSHWNFTAHKAETSSDAPTESDDPVHHVLVRDRPTLHVNSSATPSIEVLAAGSTPTPRGVLPRTGPGPSPGPTIVSPGPDLSDGIDPLPSINRGPSDDDDGSTDDDDEHAMPGFRLPDDFRNASAVPSSPYRYNLDSLFTAGHPSSFVDEDDSFYLSATDTECGPSTLATEDRTVFPNLPSEDDFTASSRSASMTTSALVTPLRFNPKTGAALLPESAPSASSRSEASNNKIEDETNRQLQEAVRQVLPVFPPYDNPLDDSETESSADDEDSRLDQRDGKQRRSVSDDDDEDSFYLSATDTEGPVTSSRAGLPTKAMTTTTTKTSLLPLPRPSSCSPTNSPVSIAKDKNQIPSGVEQRRTVASLMPELSAKASIDALSLPNLSSYAAGIDDPHATRSPKPRAESPRNVATSPQTLSFGQFSRSVATGGQTLSFDPDGRNSSNSNFNKSITSALHGRAPPVSPNRAPRTIVKTAADDGRIASASSPPSLSLRKLPAPTRDLPRTKVRNIEKEKSGASPRCDDAAATDWFAFEGWADFGCADSKPQPPQPTQQNIAATRHKVVPAVEGLENLLANAKSKSTKTSSSINSAPAFSRTSVQQIHKITCNDSVSDVIKSLESATSSRRSRSLSTSRQSPRRPTSRSTSRPRRSKSSDRRPITRKRDQSPSPFGIASDLESLSSSQSNRSARSSSGPSLHNSRNTSQHRSVSGESCHSSGHSTKSFASHTSEASKKITADIMRLERRLSRGSRVTIAAPPGKLGVFLENRKDSRGTVVTKVRPESPLAALIQVGDRILAIDGADVSLMTVSEITTIMQQTNNRNRTLTVLKTTEDSMAECEV